MAKAKNKTIANDASVTAFLDAIKDDQKREDSYKLLEIMTRLSGCPPKMWGSSIIGFGSYHYKYESGREGDMCRIGFSPRAQNLTLYIITGFSDYEEELSRLGPHKLGKSCLYIRELKHINLDVLEEILTLGMASMKKKFKTWDE